MNNVVSNIIWVGCGSCIGGVLRYLVSKGIQTVCDTIFPWGTFIVNVIGCLIIGLVYGYLDKGGYMNDGLRLFLTVGFCGGFTTFSTFMNENYLLFSGTENLSVLLYTGSSVLVGFFMVYLGYFLSR